MSKYEIDVPDGFEVIGDVTASDTGWDTRTLMVPLRRVAPPTVTLELPRDVAEWIAADSTSWATERGKALKAAAKRALAAENAAEPAECACYIAEPETAARIKARIDRLGDAWSTNFSEAYERCPVHGGQL